MFVSRFLFLNLLFKHKILCLKIVQDLETSTSLSSKNPKPFQQDFTSITFKK